MLSASLKHGSTTDTLCNTDGRSGAGDGTTGATREVGEAIVVMEQGSPAPGVPRLGRCWPPVRRVIGQEALGEAAVGLPDRGTADMDAVLVGDERAEAGPHKDEPGRHEHRRAAQRAAARERGKGQRPED